MFGAFRLLLAFNVVAYHILGCSIDRIFCGLFVFYS